MSQHVRLGVGVDHYPHSLLHPLSPPLPMGVSVVTQHNQGRSSFLFSKSLLAWSTPAGPVPSGAGETTVLLGNWERLPQAQLPRPSTAVPLRVSDH